MKFRVLTLVAVVSLMAGCATKKNVDTVVVVEPEVNCMDAMIGPASLARWCSAFPDGTVGCDCEEGQDSLSGIARQLTEKGLSPSDIQKWYEILPSDIQGGRMVRWMVSGIPVSEVREWFDIGLTVDETAAAYQLGEPINRIKAMVAIGLNPSEMREWLATEIPFFLWKQWIDAGVAPAVARDATELNKLKTIEQVKTHILNSRFTQISPETTRIRSWICSRGNEIGQLENLKGERVSMIKRYVMLDVEGYSMPPMSLFDSEIKPSNYRIVRRVERGSGHARDWAECPVSVITSLEN